ncbi:MAG: hypothetical protein US89_C0007G0007 [Candidatus Peregrinibacteria bacterium GW2011_GWF2_38_29]|nr:MAG: hypothetical protein US89_C0007G0007 [Candidatus Peregrinibacteria bacterium GW2011_GWF2_38_29]HBB02825.1 DUF2164 domain-containing protein [Candidatus Peregrinibacteria bacterium]
MAEIKRKWDLLTKERRAGLIREIITYFKEERDEEIGMLASEDILDFFLENLGKDIYKRAVDDLKAIVKQNFENLEIDLDLLLK